MSPSAGTSGTSPSPWFARLGQEALERGNPAEAVRLCTTGVEEYPWYGTGHLVLGKALGALGREAESVLAFRRAVDSIPDAGVAQRLLREAEERERTEFAAYAARQREEHPAASLTFEEYSAGIAAPGEDSAGFLQKQVLAAKQDETAAEASAKPSEIEEPSRIVTVTLAEIYASQGEYGEAVEAYRALKALRPAEAGRFDDRIRQLEQLAAEQDKPLE